MEPATWVHNLTAEGMKFTITETVRASKVEKWLHAVKERFLDAAPVKCVGLDCEFTTPRDKPHQRVALLQLSVAFEVLLFQLCWADHVPQLLRDFLGDPTNKFCGAAISNDVRMLSPYGIQIASVHDLQVIIPNPTTKPIPSLYDLSNATIGTKLEKKKIKRNKKKGDEEEEEEEELIYGWAKVPLSDKQVLYAALDARLSFEIARAPFGCLYWQAWHCIEWNTNILGYSH
jgi:ribonuclease D